MTHPWQTRHHLYNNYVSTKEADVIVARLVEALDRTLWHSDNLQRYIDHKPVRDLAESRAGSETAREILSSYRD